MERRAIASPAQIIEQLKEKLRNLIYIDYITLSGSGEPTLYSHTAELIARIKDSTDTPLAVLTNGSLLWEPQVRAGLAAADLVIPSLDVGNGPLFHYVNRPCSGLTFETVLTGIRRFRQEFAGALWLEVFLLNGITATQASVEEIAFHAGQIAPDTVQLNTVTRPPCEKSARAVPRERMLRFAQMFSCPAEVIVDYQGIHAKGGYAGSRNDILQLLQRRPCTLEDVSESLSIRPNEAVKHLQHMVDQNQVRTIQTEDRNFYQRIATCGKEKQQP
jgi:wyosine [tRNA(Phe)-imidazoG37] synthetase (radical SAM superfamily)